MRIALGYDLDSARNVARIGVTTGHGETCPHVLDGPLATETVDGLCPDCLRRYRRLVVQLLEVGTHHMQRHYLAGPHNKSQMWKSGRGTGRDTTRLLVEMETADEIVFHGSWGGHDAAWRRRSRARAEIIDEWNARRRAATTPEESWAANAWCREAEAAWARGGEPTEPDRKPTQGTLL